MSNTSTKRVIDAYGEWVVYDNGTRTLIPGTETQLWWNEHPTQEPTPDEPEPTPEPTVWDELAAAYQEGVNSIDE